MDRFLFVCLGSAVGGGLRYLVSLWTKRALETGFPVGTFTVNILGSFLIAALMYIGTETTSMSPTLRLTLTTGLMGGFTTYSTFSYETMKHLQDGAWAMALGNVLLTVTGCLVACFWGWTGAKLLYAH